MPISPLNNTGTNRLPGVGDGAPVPAILPKSVPGFDPAGRPLGDAEVWNLFVGRGADRRPVTTVKADGKKGLDGWEQKQLLGLLQKDPRAFLTRLLADSMNGSPVEYTFTKELKGFGVGRIEFRAENGHVDTTASVEVYNKAADGFLKAYLAKDPRANGTRSKIAFEIKGDLNKEAGVDNISLEVRAENVPALSPEKLMEVERVKADIKAVLSGKGRSRDKQKEVQDIVGRAIARASDIPLGFFMELITDRHNLDMTFKEKTRSTAVHAETGEGRYALTFTDLLDGENRDEADLGAKLAGRVSDDKDRIEISEAKVYTTDKLAISWGEDDKPVLHRIDAQTGEKAKVDDHLAEIMMYLPMALALVNRGGIF